MRSRKRAVKLSDWRAIASLGEQLVNAPSLMDQHERIVDLATRMVPGRVDVWLNEDLFRLPNRSEPRTFSHKPHGEAMRQALELRKTYSHRASAKSRSKRSVAAIPIEDQGLVLGVLQVTRPNGPTFGPEDLAMLEGIAGVGAVGLYASLRGEVERFRLDQLNLVGEVSAEIATVLHIDELSRRVCELIQKAFNYYYVAIFTLRPGETRLRFRSSAGSRKTGIRKAPLALEVDLGQGLIGNAAETGELITSRDVRDDKRYRFIQPLPATRSEVAIPLKLEDRVLGVLDVQADRPDAFHRNDLLLLRALADNVARAVESARLYGDLQRRADQLTLLAEVGRRVTSTLELREMLEQTAGLIHERFGYQQVSLFTVHPNRRLIEYEAGSGGRSQALNGQTIKLDDQPGIIPWVARTGKTVLTNDVDLEPLYRPSPLKPKNTHSELAVPLVFADRVLGILDIQSERRNAFSEDDRLMFEAVGGTIAASIRNADLYRTEHWRRQVGEGLREVAGLLSKHINVEQVLQAILAELERNLPVDVSAIWLLEQEGPYLAAVRGTKAADVERAGASSGSTAGIESMMQSAGAVIRQPSDPMWPSGKAARFSSEYSSLAVPMRVGDRGLGLIALAHRNPGRYGHEAQAMAETFASYAAVAIENSRLFDTAQEQAYASAALLQVAQAVAGPASLDETLNSIMRIMPILLGIKSCALYTWDAMGEQYIPSAEFGMDDRAKEKIWGKGIQSGQFRMLDHVRRRGEIASRALHAGDRPDVWPSLQPTATSARPLLRSERLLIALPVIVKSDLLGVLLVEEGIGARRFRSRRQEIILGISQQIALALQNDLLQSQMVAQERLETEGQLARQIQSAFIPATLPVRDGWEFAARWEMARQVGGDFYDFVDLSDGRLGLIVADVSDKGMPAALFMALTRTLFRATASETDVPAEVLRKMNSLLLPDTSQGMFVTAVYAVLDPGRRELTYANAGHNPPLWLRTDASVEKLGRTTLALGVMDSPTVSQQTIQLRPSETVLIYTDGLTEAFSPNGELFGETRLLEAVAGPVAISAEALVASIQSDLMEHVASLGLSDDLTMLALKCK